VLLPLAAFLIAARDLVALVLVAALADRKPASRAEGERAFEMKHLADNGRDSDHSTGCGKSYFLSLLTDYCG